jgi:hypothetical protein
MKSFLAFALFLSTAFAQSTIANSSATDLKKMVDRFAPVELKADISHLSGGDKAALRKLLEAAKIIDSLQLRQRWSKNEALWAALKKDKSELGRARAEYFWINKGPWSKLDGDNAFMGAFAGIKPPDHYPAGGNFYPENATKEELEKWMNSLPDKQKTEAQWFFTTIRRDKGGKFKIVPYSQEYHADLVKLAKLTREAANLTTNASLKKFLAMRADAYLSNDYFDSDVAWMDLDSPLDVTIGPYETYNDEFFSYKAAFEAYINVRDEAETEKVKFFGKYMQDIENNLPIPDEHKNKQIGAASPMVIVNEIYGAGDGNMGIATAAYNLPNDERVVNQKGSKRIMLKNIQEAKFQKTLTPIAKLLLSADDQKDLDFNSFFTHVLAHEITHGLGPHAIKVNGKDTTPRQELQNTYNTLEEAKADVTGLFALQYLMDKNLLGNSLGSGEAAERKLYSTFLASAFRTLHFGLTDSHARGMAIQFNYIMDKGGFVAKDDGTFAVDFSKIKQAVKDLDNELLMIEATGDLGRARKMMSDLVVIRPVVQKALDKLKASVPNDIRPNFVTANEVLSSAPAKTVTKKQATTK